MPLVKSIEEGIEQTESVLATVWTCGACLRTSKVASRSALESAAKEGDSPVYEAMEDDCKLHEYCALDFARECGSHLLPTLNTT